MSQTLSFQNLRVRGTPREHKKHRFLCYCDATLVVNGVELLRIRGISLHTRNSDGSFWISFPSEVREDERFPHIYPVTREMRETLTAAMKSAYQRFIAERDVA